jgi:hypothetical protein
VESWKIDSYVQDIIAKELSSLHGITIVKVKYDHKQLRELNLADGKIAEGSRNLQASVVDQISAIAKANSLDAVIVISYRGEGHHVLPLILFTGSQSVALLRAIGDINVLDGPTHENIGMTWFSAVDYGEDTDSSYWPPFDGKTEKLRILENKFKNALKKELIIKLKHLGFIEDNI